MNTKTKTNPTETCESIKLGIDAHAKWYYVGRQVDGATPQPVQKMTDERLLRFVAKPRRALSGSLTTARQHERPADLLHHTHALRLSSRKLLR